MYNFHDLKNSQNKEAVTKYNTRRPADLSSSEINQHVDYWLSLITSKVKNKVDMRWFNTYESGSIFVKKLYRYEIKIGIVASGDIFCTEIEMKNKINKNFKADVVDMECAAIGQVCYLDNVPFISIRSVSDVPNGKNVSTHEENLELAAKRCANVLKEFCMQ